MAKLVCIEKIGKVHSGNCPEGVKSPDPRVDVEQLEFSVAEIPLELDLYGAVIVNGLQEALRQLFHDRFIDSFDICRCATKFSGMLSLTPGDQRTVRAAIFEEGAVG